MDLNSDNRINGEKGQSGKTFGILPKSAKGSDFVIFLVCIGIASVFWLFLSLYEEVERDYDVPLKIENMPDSIVIVESIPASINVSVQGKGVQFIKFLWHDVSPLRVKFNDFANSSGTFSIPRQKLEALFRDYFGQGIKITSLRPESIKAAYTSNIGKKVKLEVDCDIQPKLQYVVSGPIKANVDSVMIYSANDIPRNLTAVSTYPIVKTGLKDTTVITVKIRPIEGMRIIPDQVTVTVPIEPLISKRRIVPIEVLNLPENVRLITFPSTAEVTYLLPMSTYNTETNVKLFVDFDSINRESQKVKVQTAAISGSLRNFSFKPDSVEYIIETSSTPEKSGLQGDDQHK